jgi:hypothetical protein
MSAHSIRKGRGRDRVAAGLRDVAELVAAQEVDSLVGDP